MHSICEKKTNAQALTHHKQAAYLTGRLFLITKSNAIVQLKRSSYGDFRQQRIFNVLTLTGATLLLFRVNRFNGQLDEIKTHRTKI